MSEVFGRQQPRLLTPPPGPNSRELAVDLRRYESRNVTYLSDQFPVFWEEARGSNVRDVDGNVYVDLTAAFAVAAAGHAHPAIVKAVGKQARTLLHGMGDVHPPAIKARLLRRLAEITPDGLTRSILANSGSEAVEAALKTAHLATGRPGVLAFDGGYHGLTIGALALSGRPDFRDPFVDKIAELATFLPYPGSSDSAEESLAAIAAALDAEAGRSIGAVIAEPIQGRGGDVVPPDGWLRGLRDLTADRGIVLILDEVYTGFGRTGEWFACQHEGVVPDLLVVGKALTGGLPFAACIGTDAVMAAWPESSGEAIHTSTFLGHPLGCAAALAAIEVLEEENLIARSAEEGAHLLHSLRARLGRHPAVEEIRGRGMMVGIELSDTGETGAQERVGHLMTEALRRGYIVLGSGVRSNVLSLSPPLCIQRELLDAGIDCLVELFVELE